MHASSASALLLLALFAGLASAHGYLSSPPPRGIEKATYNIDSLKSPNTKGLCRGEPVGKKTQVRPGQSLTLGLTITAPHVGPCRVTLLDVNLKNERPVAEKMDCAAPGGPGKWTITLPSNVHGHKVLRWYWEGRHVSPAEPYEQCIDLVFGGEGSGGNDDEPSYDGEEEDLPVRSRSHAPTPPQPKYDGADEQRQDFVRQPKGDKPYGSNDSTDTYGQDDGAGNDYGNAQPASGYPPRGQRPSSKRPKGHRRPRPPTNADGGDYPSSGSSDPSSSGGSCQNGAYQCASDGGFRQCANGQWAKMQCAQGTKCRQTGTTIVCDWA